MQQPPDPIECPWCDSKYAPRLYGWHEGTEARYAVRCLNCGAQGPKKEIGPLAIEAWNKRAPQWMPVEEDGEISTWVSVEDKGRHIAVYVDDDRYAEETLPDGYAICRLTAAPQA